MWTTYEVFTFLMMISSVFKWFSLYRRYLCDSGRKRSIPKRALLKVIAPIMEAQLVETTILNLINHQSLIATKTSRVVYAADGDGIMEFGLRRAQGPDAGLTEHVPL